MRTYERLGIRQILIWIGPNPRRARLGHISTMQGRRRLKPARRERNAIDPVFIAPEHSDLIRNAQPLPPNWPVFASAAEMPRKVNVMSADAVAINYLSSENR